MHSITSVVIAVLGFVLACSGLDATQELSALDDFNSWINKGLRSANSTVEVSLVLLDRGSTSRRTTNGLALRILHTDESLVSYPKLALPLASHILSTDFVAQRPYVATLKTTAATKGGDGQLTSTQERMVLALLAEIALGMSSPLRPWCRLLLSVPRVPGLSTPPTLWPVPLVSEVVPRYLRSEIANRASRFHKWFELPTTQRILKQLSEWLVEYEKAHRGDTAPARSKSVFNVSSKQNVARVWATVEASAIGVRSQGGLHVFVMPLANFFETEAVVNSKTYFEDAGANVRPFVRTLAPAVAEASNVALTLHLEAAQVSFAEGGPSDIRQLSLRADAPVSIDRHLASLGRLPLRVAWDVADCVLVVFTKGMDTSPTDVKLRVATALEPYLHHYSCLAVGEMPLHGLVGALIASLPKETPASFAECVEAEVRAAPPATQEAMLSIYDKVKRCLALVLPEPAAASSIIRTSIVSLKSTVQAYLRDELLLSDALRESADNAAIRSLESAPAEGNRTELLSIFRTRLHRRRISSELLSRLEQMIDATTDSVTDEL